MYKRRGGRRSWGRKVYTYKRTQTEVITFSTASFSKSVTFKLNYLPNYSEYSALYDQYMITKVAVKLVPRGNVSSIGSDLGSNLLSVIDYNDSGVLSSVDQANEYATVKRTTDRRMHTRVFRPMFLRPAYVSSISTGYSSTRGWISISDPGVVHYGLKFVWQNSSLLEEVEYDMYTTYYVKFKNSK